MIAAGPTKIVVGGTIAIGMGAAFFALLGWRWAIVACLYLAYEAWTFGNQYAADTISEVLWYLATRPLVPLLFGAALGWAVTAGVIPPTTEGVWVGVAVGFLYGHFFFQSQETYRRLI